MWSLRAETWTLGPIKKSWSCPCVVLRLLATSLVKYWTRSSNGNTNGAALRSSACLSTLGGARLTPPSSSPANGKIEVFLHAKEWHHCFANMLDTHHKLQCTWFSSTDCYMTGSPANNTIVPKPRGIHPVPHEALPTLYTCTCNSCFVPPT